MIFFRPIQDQNTASSRLRVWNIQPHIKNSVVAIADKYSKEDTLVIQKIPDIDLLRKAKTEGARVIYDIDDFYWENPEYKVMLDECDHITVDTEEKKKMLSEYKDKVTVIPDSLDWDGTKKESYGEGVIGWTGYGNNAQYLNPILDKIPFPIRLVTTSDWPQYIHGKGENIQSRPWSLAMVDKYLAECDIGLYYLPKRDFEQCKSANKLLKNWAIGIPTYTSPMPAYVEAMKAAGVGEKYLVKTDEDWKKIGFVPFDEKLREYALQFTAENIAKKWISLLSLQSQETTTSQKKQGGKRGSSASQTVTQGATTGKSNRVTTNSKTKG